jgi:membrane protein DedA with SNARE-associated domain
VLHHLIDPILIMIKDAVAAWGYLAVILMMAIESFNIPLPSEAIMPTAGFLVQQQKMNFHLAALAGAVGCVLGSVPSYFLGLYGGRPFLAKYGRYFLLREKDMDHGDLTFLACRMLPVVRTFISFPAGVLKAHFGMFVGYTFFGSLIWCYALTYVGIIFGDHMEVFTDIWHKFDLAIVLVCVALFSLYLYRHLKHD